MHALTYRYWCYGDYSAYECVDLLPIRTNGDCHDGRKELPCGMKYCYCVAEYGKQFLLLLAPELYEMRTNKLWPLTATNSWMHFAGVKPSLLPYSQLMSGVGAELLPDIVWPPGDAVVFYSAITSGFGQNFCQQIPAKLMTSSVSGVCDSPSPLPTWDYGVNDSRWQDLSWKHGSCRDRGFFIVHSVLYNVTDCNANASWIRENVRELSILSLENSRVTFMA